MPPAAGLKILEFRGFFRARDVNHWPYAPKSGGLAGSRRALPHARRSARAWRGFARRSSHWRTISGTAVISQSDPWQSGPSANRPRVGAPLLIGPAVGLDREAEAMGVGSACPCSSRLWIKGGLRSGRCPVQSKARSVVDRLRSPSGRLAVTANPSPSCFGHASVQQQRTAVGELGLNTAMHFERKTMTMRVPEGTEVSQEPRLLLDGQVLPDVLERGSHAVDHRLPRRAMRFSRVASDADSGGEASSVSIGTVRTCAAPRLSARAVSAIVRAWRSP